MMVKRKESVSYVLYYVFGGLLVFIFVSLCLGGDSSAYFNASSPDNELTKHTHPEMKSLSNGLDGQGVKKNAALDSENVPNELDGCYHVYLDCGSNRGVQVRKLYEPELYPDAPVNTLFKKIFGKVGKRREVCSVGFEPNAKHTEYLKRIESSYNKCGYRTLFKVPTGLADYDGEGSYFSDNSKEFYEWGGGVIEKRVTSKANTGKVEIIRLAKYIKDIVNTRDTGASEQDLLSYNPPRVMMKIDIEGSEKDVLIDMAFSGTLETIDFAFIEYHDDHLTDPADRQKTEDARMVANTLSKYSNFKILSVDDETYGLSDEPLPKC